ncbi:MAG: SURF1 family protein [Jiangellaceae bacterium]
MNRFLLTPRWVAVHAATAAVVAGFVALGWWQLGVYRDSDARQDLRDRPAVPITEIAVPGGRLAPAADRAVVATGTYVRDQPLLVPARVHDGVLGSYAVALLRTADDGMLVVLRGWVDDPDDPRVEPPGGEVTVAGHLLAPETAADAAAPGADLLPGRVGFVAPDVVAEESALPLGDFYPAYLLLENEQPPAAAPPDALELGTVEPIRHVSPWQNLSYWAQWWVFAGAAVVFWASFVRAALRRRRGPVAAQSAREVTNA